MKPPPVTSVVGALVIEIGACVANVLKKRSEKVLEWLEKKLLTISAIPKKSQFSLIRFAEKVSCAD